MDCSSSPTRKTLSRSRNRRSSSCRRVRVLELVDHDPREAARVGLGHRGIPGEQVARAELQVVEVQGGALTLARRVGGGVGPEQLVEQRVHRAGLPVDEGGLQLVEPVEVRERAVRAERLALLREPELQERRPHGLGALREDLAAAAERVAGGDEADAGALRQLLEKRRARRLQGRARFRDGPPRTGRRQPRDRHALGAQRPVGALDRRLEAVGTPRPPRGRAPRADPPRDPGRPGTRPGPRPRPRRAAAGRRPRRGP